jgi:hypothetical protein
MSINLLRLDGVDLACSNPDSIILPLDLAYSFSFGSSRRRSFYPRFIIAYSFRFGSSRRRSFYPRFVIAYSFSFGLVNDIVDDASLNVIHPRFSLLLQLRVDIVDDAPLDASQLLRRSGFWRAGAF